MLKTMKRIMMNLFEKGYTWYKNIISKDIAGTYNFIIGRMTDKIYWY